MADNDSTVSDHSTPATGRVALAATAAWCATTLCDELLEQVAKIGIMDTPQPGQALLTISALAVRVKELATAAALCLEEDEANKPLAELERTVTHG
jgi:hypothetical protein